MSYATYAPGGLAAANQVRSLGRNEDTQLVHMTPGEVQALQAMAERHGGSLTINPHTGLPEAGFLSGLLKVAAPIALGYFAGPALGGMVAPGASTAMQAGIGAGLIAGGLTTLQTGDLGKGLTSGLMSGALTGAMSSWNPFGASTTTNPTSNVVSQTSPAMEALKVARAEEALNPAVNTGLLQQGTSMMTSPSISNAYIQPAVSAAQAGAAAAPEAGIGLWDKFQNLSTPAKLGIGAAGLGVLGALTEQPGIKGVTQDKGTIRPYEYKTGLAAPQPGRTQFLQPRYDVAGNPILDTQERNYFTQNYTALPTYAAAGGGLMQASPLMGNENMYPQSQQEHTQFATPTQMPTSAEVVDSGYEVKADPYTGQPVKMADGGSTKEYTYDPATQKYAEVLPPAPVQTYNYGMWTPVIADMNNQRAGAGDEWAKMMRGFAPGFGLGAASQQVAPQSPLASMWSGLLNQAQNAQPNLQQYSYDPQTQRYTKLADGGDITSGFQGYGQQQGGGRNPLDLLKALQANQEQPQQTTTVIRQASGGLSNLGSYSDGGHLLKGPGDGVSDDIPAMIGKHQPARLADGEFVIPARIVSELGNGSTDAGARRLYAMMDRVQANRKKSIGKGKVAVDSKAEKYLPA